MLTRHSGWAATLAAFLAACGGTAGVPGASDASLGSDAERVLEDASRGFDAASLPDSGGAAADASEPAADAARPLDAAVATTADASACQNTCTQEGKKRCASTTVLETCTADENGCLSWVGEACPSGDTCMVHGAAACM